MKRRKIYLAGPDVFFVNGERILQQHQKMCAEAGFVGLSPLDGDLPEGVSGWQRAELINQANVDKILEADAMIANVRPWCGLEPDSGTCVEIGRALQQEKPVFLYGDEGTVAHRYEAAGYKLLNIVPENFGLNVNLMVQVPSKSYAFSFAGALENARAYFARLDGPP